LYIHLVDKHFVASKIVHNLQESQVTARRGRRLGGAAGGGGWVDIFKDVRVS